jgi:hypothetical protein
MNPTNTYTHTGYTCILFPWKCAHIRRYIRTYNITHSHIYEGWGLSHSNIFVVVVRLTDREEKWEYTNGSGWC